MPLLPPTQVDPRQLPDTLLTRNDLFGPEFWRFNEALQETADGTRVLFHTQSPFIMGKLILWKGKDKLSQTVYDELNEGTVQFKAGQAPANAADLRAWYMRTGTIERDKWVFNEPPAGPEQVDGTRTVFHTAFSILRPDMLLVFYDGLPLSIGTEVLFTTPNTLTFVAVTPQIGIPLDWTYVIGAA